VGVAQGQVDVAAHVEVVEQRAALRDQAELAVVEGELGGDHLEPGLGQLVALEQHPGERRLAGAGAAQQHHHLTRRQRQRRIVDQHAAVGQDHAQAAHRERAGRGGRSARGGSVGRRLGHRRRR
jgi:hypothetical protein